MSDTKYEQMTFEFETCPPIKGYPELHWTGKRAYKSTVYYPAQRKETYGEAKDGWLNKIYWGDNLQVMSHLLKDYRGKINLIYIDPPLYYPDFITTLDDGTIQIIEVKGDNMIDNDVVQAKAEAAREMASASKMEYLMLAGSRVMQEKII